MAVGKRLRKFIPNPAELESLRQAVQSAEKKSRVEIVPVLAESSTPLASVKWILLLFFMSMASALHYLSWSSWDYSAAILGVFVLGWLLSEALSRLPWVCRLVLPEGDQDRAVLRAAELEFHRLKVFETQYRSGVLIYISLLEHRVIILADEGLNDRIPQEFWTEQVETITQHIRKNQLAQGVTQVISVIGQKVQEVYPGDHFAGNRANELLNDLILREAVF